MAVICVKCGKETEFEEMRGSYKHPYCNICFNKVWKKESKYWDWLKITHE